MAERNVAIRLIKLCGKGGVKEWKEEVTYGKRPYIELEVETSICLGIDLR